LRTKKLHSGIFRRLYSCKNSQVSPFLQRPLSQCLQTREPKPPPAGLLEGAEESGLAPPVAVEEETCRSGQWDLRGQLPETKALQMGRSGGRLCWCVFWRKGVKEKVYRGAEWASIACAPVWVEGGAVDAILEESFVFG